MKYKLVFVQSILYLLMACYERRIRGCFNNQCYQQTFNSKTLCCVHAPIYVGWTTGSELL